MATVRKGLRVVLFIGAGAACVAAALQLRDEQAKVAGAADDIERQLDALDPVTRAAVVTRLTADASKELKSRLG